MGTSPDTTSNTLLVDEPDADVVQFDRRIGFDPKGKYLRFGHDSQAYYSVPVGDRDADVMLARPYKLTEHDHYAFDQVLGQLRLKLSAAVEGFTEYEDQRHVRPDIRVSMPGTYLTTRNGRLAREESLQYRVTFKYGRHLEEVTFDSSLTDMHTVQRALQRLLNTVRLTIAKSLPETETVQSVESVEVAAEAM